MRQEEDNVKLIVLKTPTVNKSFNDSDAFYITIPICIILTHIFFSNLINDTKYK